MVDDLVLIPDGKGDCYYCVVHQVEIVTDVVYSVDVETGLRVKRLVPDVPRYTLIGILPLDLNTTCGVTNPLELKSPPVLDITRYMSGSDKIKPFPFDFIGRSEAIQYIRDLYSVRMEYYEQLVNACRLAEDKRKQDLLIQDDSMLSSSSLSMVESAMTMMQQQPQIPIMDPVHEKEMQQHFLLSTGKRPCSG